MKCSPTLLPKSAPVNSLPPSPYFSVTIGLPGALFAGKSYSIFALLFGFTFYIQYSNQQAKGKDFGYRFLWRLLLLTIFATLNAAEQTSLLS